MEDLGRVAFPVKRAKGLRSLIQLLSVFELVGMATRNEEQRKRSILDGSSLCHIAVASIVSRFIFTAAEEPKHHIVLSRNSKDGFEIKMFSRRACKI